MGIGAKPQHQHPQLFFAKGKKERVKNFFSKPYLICLFLFFLTAFFHMNPIVLSLIVLTCVVSYYGLNNPSFFDRYKFSVGAILYKKEYNRLLTSAFLHADFSHLLFNLLTLYFFSEILIQYFGVIIFLIIYFISILGGGVLTLFLHKKDFYYSAIGASGGVVGVVFSSIAIYPTIDIYLFFALPIKGWLYGILYLFFSIYGMRTQMGNMGHAAHFGGAAVGLLATIILSPVLLFQNQFYIILLSIPILYLAIQMIKERE
jgi:membrane associated rhomboid family serine protease